MTTAVPALRAAIIGTGGVAQAHADAIAELSPRIALVAVADVDPEKARAFADRINSSAAVYSSLHAMLSAERVDLVHICTPPQTHVALAVESLRAGVPVLIEKPTALSLAEMDHLADVSRETRLPALTVFQHRFGSGARRLARLLQDGALGRPLVATCETLWYRPPSYFDAPWRGRWEVEGGGPTMGHGVHQFDLLLAILGPWRRLSAFAARQSLAIDTEDVSMALVEFENGALATVVNSIVSPHEASRLRFDFEYATVEVNHVYGYSDADWTFSAAPGHEGLADLWDADRSSEITSHRLQIEAIVDALTSGTSPSVDLSDARRTLEFAAATYASAFRGVAIHAGQIVEPDPFMVSMDGGMAPWSRVREPLRGSPDPSAIAPDNQPA